MNDERYKKTLDDIRAYLGEDLIVQRKLSGLCIYCGEPNGKHLFSCPEMSNYRYMFGEEFVNDMENEFYEDKKSGM